MGNIKLSNLQGFSGRIGPVVAYINKEGKQIFRTYVKPKNPRTPAQVANRARLGFATKCISPLCKVIKRGYPDNPKAYRQLIGQACRHAVEGEYPDFTFNYSALPISAGTLPLPRASCLTYVADTRTLTLTWSTETYHDTGRPKESDSVTLVCLHTGPHPSLHIHHAGKRRHGRSDFTLPAGRQIQKCRFWLTLSSNCLSYVSDSRYLQAKYA